ncbi:MFS transporter [Kribbella italica]|uniref:Na+/melibiose symporter-like transporter n=1 Tax=Kribbella italica TaxID=1540520 RepID=A0A7W9J2L0_9ACTN|nr:Na+/melibiose symporter-like transporter [Kribbella italica]
MARSTTAAGRTSDFGRLWFGESVSLLGDQVASLALPTAAVLLLGASATEVGALTAVGTLAYPLLGLFAGALMDRVRRRPVMILANVVRMGCFAVLAVCAATGSVTMPLLYAVAAAVGVATIFFDIAYQTYLPSLLAGEKLAQGNVRLELSSSLSRLAGPSLGGLLLQYGGLAIGFGVNAASFAASMLGVTAIRTPEPAPNRGDHRTSLLADILDGVRLMWRHPVLRPLTVSAALRNLGINAHRTVLIVFLYRSLDLSAGAVGLVFTVGAAGALTGAAFTSWLRTRLGVGRTLLLTGLEGLVWLLTPLSLIGGAPAWVLGLMFVSSLWLPVWNATVTTLRQQITPAAYLGRVQATARTINLSTIPIGAVLGGVVADSLSGLGDRTGPVLALTLCGGVAALSLVQLGSRRIRSITTLPDRPDPAGTEES